MGNQQPLNGLDPTPGRPEDRRLPQNHGAGGLRYGGTDARGGYAKLKPYPGTSGTDQHHQQQPVARSSCDAASITPIDAEVAERVIQQHPAGERDKEKWLDDDTVPTVFRWQHGGRQVYITGTFNGWSRQIPMHRSGNDFTYVHNLKRGKHAFKFIVDDEWRFAPEQPTVTDVEGRNINNFIDVTDFTPYTGDRDFEQEKTAAEGLSDVDSKDAMRSPDRNGEVFSQNIPNLYEYMKEPPPVPRQLLHITLNEAPHLRDTAALPVPRQHVALNHFVYCTGNNDNMMAMGITQRYKTKFVTTVYYSLCASS